MGKFETGKNCQADRETSGSQSLPPLVALLSQGALSGLRVTISLGVATAPGRSILGVNDLIRIADDALYTAKREGRNQVVFGA